MRPKRGHPLSATEVAMCRRRYADRERTGVTLRQLAAELGIHKMTLSCAIRGRTWAWLDDPPPVTSTHDRRGERNPRARYTAAQVRAAYDYQRAHPACPVAAVARRFGLAYRAMREVAVGRTWRHVTGGARLPLLSRATPAARRAAAQPNAKLTEAQVAEIRRLVAAGETTMTAAARRYSVSVALVSRIMSGQRRNTDAEN